MSQKLTRKSQSATVVNDEKEKDSPVKEMKKKIAANTEKEKQSAEKAEKPVEKNDKSEPAEKHKSAEKTEKNADKPEKNEKPEKVADKKSAEKTDKNGDKKADKSIEKKSEPADKDGDKIKEKSAKSHNGTHNGAPAANGDDANGTVSDDSEDDLVIEEDEIFPELTYDDSDTDAEDVPSRSLTRRSQVKVTKTPETPRPASEKESDDSKESKLLKLKDDSVTSDRKLRSADSPKPESKKVEKKTQESPKKQESAQEEEKSSSKKDVEEKSSSKKDVEEKSSSKKDVEEEIEKAAPTDGKPEEKTENVETEVVVEVESTEAGGRSRARVSPYWRPHDRTCTSTAADYSGNNSTMEMDVTESSLLEEPPADTSAYLRGLRGIRARASYKPLADVPLARRPRPNTSASLGRPTGAVVGRKRRYSPPAPDAPLGIFTPVGMDLPLELSDDISVSQGKRQRFLDRLTMPFRRSGRRNDEIVGINTDLPMTAPVASTSFASFDPESMKPPAEPPAPPAPPHDGDARRCVLM